jgi:hypothetical protein
MTEIVSIIRPLISPITGDWTDADFDVLLEAYALVVEALEAKLLPFDEYPILSGTPEIDCNIIYKFLKDIETECIAEATRLKVESLRNRFRISMNSTFSYEFSQGDLERVQLLINELRSQISSLHSLESDHRQRLLKRLEKLQSELHKKVSDLDRFWGLVGDAGVVLGKLGKDAKPIVDRIREIANIVWQTQSRAEELPSGTQLPLSEPKPNLTNNEQT